MTLEISKARELVPMPDGQRVTKNANGVTTDIIASVRQVFAENSQQTAQLAQALTGSSELETARNIFQFVRRNVRYVLDPPNVQLIRTPADIVHNGTADCKGLAILINSLLANVGIKSAFRFVSFSAFPTVTHVYTLAFIGGKQYILDACLPNFNQEKPYTFKEDYMTQIVHVSGFGMKAQMNRLRANAGNRLAKRAGFRKRPQSSPHPQAELVPGETPLNISGFESDGEMELKLYRQGMELERDIAISVAGIGSPLVANLNHGIAVYDAAIAALENEDYDAVASIGSAIGNKKKKGGLLKKVAAGVKKVAKKTASTAKKATRAVRQSKVIKKVASGVKKAATKVTKFAAKAVTAPMRLLVKGLGEVFIPKMAPMFLYLFVTNPTTISKLPAKVQRKRKKSEKFAKFMTKAVGMKEAHFMKLVRNGIMRQYKQTPENILKARLKGQPINGIGSSGSSGSSSGGGGMNLAAMAPLLPIVMDVIKQIASIFKKNPSADETPGEDDLPDLDSDFEDIEPQAMRELTAHLTYKPASQRGEEPGDYNDESRELREELSVQNQIRNEPFGTPADAPFPTPEPEPGDEANARQAAPEEPAESAGNGSSSGISKMLPFAATGVGIYMITKRGKKKR